MTCMTGGGATVAIAIGGFGAADGCFTVSITTGAGRRATNATPIAITTAAANANRIAIGKKRFRAAIVVITLRRMAAKSSSVNGCVERNSFMFIAHLHATL